MIRAKMWTDDRVFEVEFDATPWFELATDKEIKDLAECGWSRDYPADRVALHYPTPPQLMQSAFDYIEAKGDLGFEVEVNRNDAKRWLKNRRKDSV